MQVCCEADGIDDSLCSAHRVDNQSVIVGSTLALSTIGPLFEWLSVVRDSQAGEGKMTGLELRIMNKRDAYAPPSWAFSAKIYNVTVLFKRGVKTSCGVLRPQEVCCEVLQFSDDETRCSEQKRLGGRWTQCVNGGNDSRRFRIFLSSHASSSYQCPPVARQR